MLKEAETRPENALHLAYARLFYQEIVQHDARTMTEGPSRPQRNDEELQTAKRELEKVKKEGFL